jgi:hypothetical protein
VVTASPQASPLKLSPPKKTKKNHDPTPPGDGFNDWGGRANLGKARGAKVFFGKVFFSDRAEILGGYLTE